MNRQLFLHHYLPAHLCSALVAGSVFNFIMGESINFPISIPGPGMRRMPAARSDVGKNAWVAVGVYLIPFIAMFAFLAPLTYGIPEYVILSQYPTKLSRVDVLFADWTANKSTQGGYCLPGPSTLLPRRPPSRSRRFLCGVCVERAIAMVQAAKMGSRRVRTRLAVLYSVEIRVLQSPYSLSIMLSRSVPSGSLFVFGPATQTLFCLPSQLLSPSLPPPKWSVAVYLTAYGT